MALIKCPNCGKEYSEHASKCPKCGKTMQEATTYYLSQKKNKKRGLKWILFSVFALCIVGLVLYFLQPFNHTDQNGFIAIENNEVPSSDNNPIQDPSTSSRSSSKEQVFVQEIKELFKLNRNYESVCTKRFTEYANGLDYDPILLSQDPGPADVAVNKVSQNTYVISWTTFCNGEHETFHQVLYLVDERGVLKIDNTSDEINGEKLFDYSKPASFYNVFDY